MSSMRPPWRTPSTVSRRSPRCGVSSPPKLSAARSAHGTNTRSRCWHPWKEPLLVPVCPRQFPILPDLPALRRKLSTEAVGRPLSTWNEYAIAMLASMERAFTGPRMSAAVPDSSSVAQDRYPTVEEVLYPELLTRDWQMSDSERMALTALLARHRPKCGIEIGTYQGGSLSLLSQFCDAVFSIDIDPKVAENFRY